MGFVNKLKHELQFLAMSIVLPNRKALAVYANS